MRRESDAGSCRIPVPSDAKRPPDREVGGPSSGSSPCLPTLDYPAEGAVNDALTSAWATGLAWSEGVQPTEAQVDAPSVSYPPRMVTLSAA
jgi:hypothetical protein